MISFFGWYTILGILFTFIMGSLLHFAYSFSRQNPAVAFIAPINESIWEHLKLLYFPAMLYTILESLLLFSTYPKLFYSQSLGILIGTFFIPTSFYLYYKYTHRSILFLDLLIFFFSILIAFGIGVLLYPLLLLTLPVKIIILLLDFLLAIAFFYFTYHIPNLKIFHEL